MCCLAAEATYSPRVVTVLTFTERRQPQFVNCNANVIVPSAIAICTTVLCLYIRISVSGVWLIQAVVYTTSGRKAQPACHNGNVCCIACIQAMLGCGCAGYCAGVGRVMPELCHTVLFGPNRGCLWGVPLTCLATQVGVLAAMASCGTYNSVVLLGAHSS